VDQASGVDVANRALALAVTVHTAVSTTNQNGWRGRDQCSRTVCPGLV
jgi:hypothetical protein